MATTPDFQPVSPERHKEKYFKRFDSYAFASSQPLQVLAGMELFQAALRLPIGFVQGGDDFTCAAVVGTRPDECLYVATDGRWLASYVPATMRCYPFGLAALPDSQYALCVDEASGLLSTSPADEAIFNADGSLSATLKKVLNALGDLQSNNAYTRIACKALQTHRLLIPWDITLQAGSASSRKLTGLFCVDGAALNALSDEAFVELRRCGALALAYAQMLSMPHIQDLSALAAAREQELERANAVKTTASDLLKATSGELDLSFLESDTIRFY